MGLVMAPAQAGWVDGQKKVKTHCSYCALQCGLTMTVDLKANKVLSLKGRRDWPTTRGLSCVKGTTAHLQLDHQQRLHKPQLRGSDGRLKNATWNEALDFMAHGFKQIREASGPDANACFGSGALSNETVYLLGKFARLALGTRHVDYNGRYCMSTAAAAQNAVFGLDRGLHFPLADLQKSRCILVAGANVGECLPPILAMLRKAQKAGAKIIVADPVAHGTAKMADLHLKIKPGSDLALGLALLNEIVAAGAVDRAYVAGRVEHFDRALKSAEGCTADWAAELCGVPAADIRQAASWLWTEKPSVILTGRGAEQHAKGPETLMAFIHVALALGQVGRPGGGFGSLTGQGNGQGGREHGQKADQLPGYRLIENGADRAAVAAHWGVDPARLPRKGYSAQEIFQATGREEIKGLWVVGSNPVVSAANGREVYAGLAKLKLLAVSDLFPSETAALAHVVLPAAAFAEEDGTMTNIEGRVVLRRAAVAPPGQAKPDWWALAETARRLGQESGFNFGGSEDLFNEFARVTAGARADYSGMTYQRLERNKGLFWPCPGPGHPGTERLFEERFQHPSGKAQAQALAWRVQAEEPDEAYPLRLTTGRVLQHYLTGNQTRRIPALNQAEPTAFVQVGGGLARALGLVEGQEALVSTRRGTLKLPVRVLEGQRDDTLFIPMHYGNQSSNRLTLDALSPLSKMPEFKHSAARLEAVHA
jgi:assimilatory nitrate reductase catalytic subunit